jgi:UPF0042 nucleotide-binding protein
MATVEIVSFGFLHAQEPTADRVEDLRPYRDPHVSPELRYMTANDEPVRRAVLATPGIPELIQDVAVWVDKQADTSGVVTVAAGCQGGRHRAPTVAREVAARLIAAGHAVVVSHRDLDKPVVQR